MAFFLWFGRTSVKLLASEELLPVELELLFGVFNVPLNPPCEYSLPTYPEDSTGSAFFSKLRTTPALVSTGLIAAFIMPLFPT
jgi:hypothetical protein